MSLDFVYILKWWGVLFLIGLSFLPLAVKVFSSFFDKGYLFSKVFGILILSYAIFIASSIRLLKFTGLNIFIVWVLLAGVIWFLFRKEKLEIKNRFKIFAAEELIFLVALVIWSTVRGFQPAIHDLEKFMDFGFINSIMRADYFPPRDMWFTPLSINYYYFGHLYTAVITKISSIPSYVSFNLMLSTIFAFTFSLSFSIGTNLILKVKNISKIVAVVTGFLTAFFVTLSGNLQTIYSLFSGYNGESPVPFWKLALSLPDFPNSYWYPNATRFIYHTIHEFPSYSFVVADLHGHVLSIPIVITILAILFHTIFEKNINKLFVVLISFLLALAYMTNAWDGLIYLGLTGIVIFVIFTIENYKKSTIFNVVYKSLKYFLLILILFFIFSLVFNRNFSPFASGIGLNCSPDFLIKISKIGPFVFEEGRCSVSPLWQLAILYGFFVFMLISFITFLKKKSLLIVDYFALLLSTFSLILIIVPEFLYLKDIYTGYFRANTMFKLSYQAFIMLSFTSSYFLIKIISSIQQFKSTRSKMGLYCFIFIAGIFIFFISIYPYFSIPSGYGDFKQYKGLNGINYLKEIKPFDYSAINWINKNISGQPVILEAQGDSYTDYARISANTGLPTVLGWTVHEWLWRGSYEIPSARFADIKDLYETENVALSKKIIAKYSIFYIYIGVLEKEKYKINEEKFSKLGRLIYSNTGAKIYKIN